MIRPKLDMECIKEYRDDSGRLLAIKVKIQDQNFTILNVYAPNKEEHQVHFYNYVKNVLTREFGQDKHIIIGGDFNLIMNPQLDRQSASSFKSTASYVSVKRSLNEILELYDMSDLWRRKNPNSKCFTWKRKIPSVKSRLDYWFVSNNLYDSVDRTDMEPSIRSDHSAITMHLKSTQDNKKGRGYWKLNNSFLDENTSVAGLVQGKEK